MSRTRKERAEAVKHAEQKSTNALWVGMLAGGLIALGVFVVPQLQGTPEETVSPVELGPQPSGMQGEGAARRIESLRTEVIERYPHDRGAFTQGLVWHKGFLYESTGQYGRSSLRKVRLRDGRVLNEVELGDDLFGEGLARVGASLVQLTWRSGRALVWDLGTLQQERTMSYRGQGWGACFDGSSLVTSNGTSRLQFRNPETMQIQREVRVRKNSRPVARLNELECVDSQVYANVWQKSEILRIDPTTGTVTATIDAGGLLSASEAAEADVLNGIAYVPESGHFLLTGKYWPYVFEVRFVR